MRWSYAVGRLWGTEIRLHILLLLLIPYIYWQYQPRSLLAGFENLVLFAGLFLCILLHELGHTLFARLYGIQVKSIMLWPLGGIATMSRPPQAALEMLLIAAAGPLVNLLLGSGMLALSSVIGIALYFLSLPPQVFTIINLVLVDFPRTLGALNLWLGVSNLLPIYPLDGGQILHAGLAMLVGRRRADWAALIIALPLALALIIFGALQGDYLLVFVSLLLVLGAFSLRGSLLSKLYIFYLRLRRDPRYYQLIGDFASALEIYDNEIKRRPADAVLWIQRAVVHLQLADMVHARADLEHALALAPELPMARLLRGEFFVLSDQPEIALAWYNGVIRDQPGWYPAFADRGALALRQGQLTQALGDLDRALALNPRFYLSYLLRSMVYYRLGQQKETRQDWEASLGLSPNESFVFLEYSRSILDGQQEWAEAFYNWAITRLPRSPNPYHGRGDARMRFGQLSEAIDDYSSSLHLDGKNALVYLKRGRAYAALGRIESARADFHQASAFARFRHHANWARDALAQLPVV